MTKRKPNLKSYQNKVRISVKVPGTVGIFRPLTWDKERNEYVPPKRGKVFFAVRYELDDLQRKRRCRCYFDTLAAARAWQSHFTPTNGDESANVSAAKSDHGMPLCDVIEEWRKRKYPTYASGTRDQYDKLIRLSLGSLVNIPIRSITPQVIDSWISELKENLGQYWQAKTRKSFEKELTCLGVILRYYENYSDVPGFRFPIKRRHREDIKLRTAAHRKQKDLPLEDFYLFREALRADANGLVLSALATVQYFQALRVSEAAALHWEDVSLDISNPHHSRMTINKHMVCSRRQGQKSFIAPGFKNSHALGGEKEMPLFPESFEALKAIYRIDQKGLVFHGAGEAFFSYKSIQNAYNRAFKKAGLAYTGTHVMRHGGCRRVFNETRDLGAAAQILGNVSMGTVEVYAKRYKSALTDLAQKHWEERDVSLRST